ncbi:hypothetical protein [Leptospira andrefontaineae]|uniref:Uncharacterized protein n=1 Tax=Leptospira andrefontaineae TaxID=2484976 RepID=A0A4R9GZT5_9LEPT|nr:hypothetical protein [Leptospira andrefontaineae]TGK37242.1 hypothetical protein EHO65_16815 [Leptospira andrefontaineae]
MQQGLFQIISKSLIIILSLSHISCEKTLTTIPSELEGFWIWGDKEKKIVEIIHIDKNPLLMGNFHCNQMEDTIDRSLAVKWNPIINDKVVQDGNDIFIINNRIKAILSKKSFDKLYYNNLIFSKTTKPNIDAAKFGCLRNPILEYNPIEEPERVSSFVWCKTSVYEKNSFDSKIVYEFPNNKDSHFKVLKTLVDRRVPYILIEFTNESNAKKNVGYISPNDKCLLLQSIESY